MQIEGALLSTSRHIALMYTQKTNPIANVSFYITNVNLYIGYVNFYIGYGVSFLCVYFLLSTEDGIRTYLQSFFSLNLGKITLI